MEAILAARLEVPFWCSFRVPYTVNAHFTYPVPPVTTVYGLVASALGYPADYIDPMKRLFFGVAVEREGENIETYSRIIKWDRRFQEMRTLVMKQKLYKPIYRIYLGGQQYEINKIAAALQNPTFPLFLGESDDVVEIQEVSVEPILPVRTDILDCCVPIDCGRVIGKDVTVVHLPVGFKKGKRGAWTGVEYRDYYVAAAVQLDTHVSAYEVCGRRVIIR